MLSTIDFAVDHNAAAAAAALGGRPQGGSRRAELETALRLWPVLAVDETDA